MKTSARILVVDDNKAVCDLLMELLKEDGHDVSVVFRGEDALHRLRQETYNVVLLDLMLPGIHGSRILQEIRHRSPETDVIIITSHASVDTAVEALRSGAQDYLTKPFEDLEAVLRVVRKTLDKRRLIQENERLYRDLGTKTKELESAVLRLASLNEMGQAIHSILDLKEILRFFVQLLATELGADRVSLMLLDKNSGQLMIEASVGFDEDLVHDIRVKIGEGIAGTVMQEGKPLLVDDVEKDPRFIKRTERDYRTDSFISAPLILSVPIKLKQEILGVINVNNKREGGVFTEKDLEFVSTLASQAALAIENARMFEELKGTNRKLKETHFEVIRVLAETLEAKDAVRRGNSDRLIRYATRVGDRLGLSDEEKEHLHYAAILHDIGKIGIPDLILQKTESLTEAERELVNHHPQMGADLVRRIQFLSPLAPIIEAHHEHYDGSGYPKGISGEGIPIQARIVSVVDAFDAMISDRPYRKSLAREHAIDELLSGAGSHFDPQVVEALIQVLNQDEEKAANKGKR